MDSDLARVIVVAVIGVTITISVVVMGVVNLITERRKSQLPGGNVRQLEDRLERIEQAIDAMATEVERVSEGQRFTSRLLADRAEDRR